MYFEVNDVFLQRKTLTTIILALTTEPIRHEITTFIYYMVFIQFVKESKDNNPF